MPSLYIDFARRAKTLPGPGDFLQAQGKRGNGACYFVRAARLVKRRDPQSRPRVTMQVEAIASVEACLGETRLLAEVLDGTRSYMDAWRAMFVQDLASGELRPPKIFTFHWYPRRRRARTFDQQLKDGIRRREQSE